MFGKMLLAAALVSLSSIAGADESTPKVDCHDRAWRRVFEDEVATLGLTKRADTFSSVVYGMQKSPAPYDVAVVITDCAMSRRSVRITKLMSMPTFATGSFAFVPQFAIYASAGFIRNTDMVDLVREARKLVCVIQAGVASGRAVTIDNAYTSLALECMLREALVVGDSEEIRWLRRVLGTPIVDAGIR